MRVCQDCNQTILIKTSSCPVCGSVNIGTVCANCHKPLENSKQKFCLRCQLEKNETSLPNTAFKKLKNTQDLYFNVKDNAKYFSDDTRIINAKENVQDVIETTKEKSKSLYTTISEGVKEGKEKITTKFQKDDDK